MHNLGVWAAVVLFSAHAEMKHHTPNLCIIKKTLDLNIFLLYIYFKEGDVP